MTATALGLLARVRELGIELALHGDQIRYRPRSAMPTDLLAELGAFQEDVRALLQGEIVQQKTPIAGTDKTARSPVGQVGDPASAPGDERACRETGRTPTDKTARSPACDLLSVLSVPSAAISEGAVGKLEGPDMGTAPGTRCWACTGTARWRLGEGAPWICPTCHPPGVPPAQVEWKTGCDSGGQP